MHIVDEVQADSLKRCEEMADKFRTMTLASFKGENVRDYATTVSDILIQLERDRQLPQMHLLRILDVFTSCTIMDFRVHWMGRRASIQQFICESAGKNETTVKGMANYVHFNTILDEGKRLYVELKDQWGPLSWYIGPSFGPVWSHIHVPTLLNPVPPCHRSFTSYYWQFPRFSGAPKGKR